jgi:hypothetical protein
VRARAGSAEFGCACTVSSAQLVAATAWYTVLATHGSRGCATLGIYPCCVCHAVSPQYTDDFLIATSSQPTKHVCAFALQCMRRETTAPTQIGPYKVPEGIVVWPMIYALQNSTHNWEEPEKFKPVSKCWILIRRLAAASLGSTVGIIASMPYYQTS